jgi:hypothetical protein
MIDREGENGEVRVCNGGLARGAIGIEITTTRTIGRRLFTVRGTTRCGAERSDLRATRGAA